MAVSLISKLWTKISNKRATQSIMIIGLDNSGKTSILNCLANLNLSTTTANISNSKKGETHHHHHHHKHRESDSPLISSTTSPEIIDHKNHHNSSNNGAAQFQMGSSNNIMPTAGYNYERIQYKGLILTVLDFSGQNRYRNLWQEFYNSVDGIVFVIDSSDLIRLVVARDELETMLNHPYFSSLDTYQHQVNKPSTQLAGEQSSSILSPPATHSLLNSNLIAQKQITISQGKLIQSPLETSSTSSLIGGNTLTTGANKSGSIFHHQQQQKRSSNLRRRTKVPILFLANKTDLANSVDTEVITKALNLNQLSTSRHPWFIQATSVNLTLPGIVEGFDWLVKEMSTSIN